MRPTQTDFILPPTLSQKGLAESRKHFDEITPLGFGLQYKSRWNIWSAVREFVQNAFDITTETVKRSTNWAKTLAEHVKLDYQDDVGYIEDDGSGIKFRNIFLSEGKGTTAFDRNCLRGQFGEGMKFAIIPILRDGYQVIIRTVGSDYHFSSVTMDEGQDQFDLVHAFRVNNKIKQGTCIAIKGIDPRSYKYRFVPFLEEDQILLTVREGCVSRNALDKPESIYVRDVYVGETAAYLGYNFWFEHPVKMLDPDRSTLKVNRTQELGMEFDHFFRAITTPEGQSFWKRLLGLMHKDKSEKRRKSRKLEWGILEQESGHFYPGEPERKALYDLIVEIIGTNKISWADNYDDNRTLAHLGYTNLDGILPAFLHLLAGHVQSPREIKAMSELKTETVLVHPSDFSGPFRNAFKRVSRAFQSIFIEIMDSYYDDNRNPIGKIYFYMGDYKEAGRHVGGFTSEGNIFLKFDDLFALDKHENPRLITVLHHEMAHVACYRAKKYGDVEDTESACSDLTESFENHLEQIAMLFMASSYFGQRLFSTMRSFARQMMKLGIFIEQGRRSLRRRGSHKGRRQAQQTINLHEILKKINEKRGQLPLGQQIIELNTIDRQEEEQYQERRRDLTLQLKTAWAKRDNKKLKVARGQLLKDAMKAIPKRRMNPVSSSGFSPYAMIRGYRRKATSLPSGQKGFLDYKALMLHEFYRTIYDWMREVAIGTRGFTVMRYQDVIRNITQQEGQKVADAYRNPGCIGALLITCRQWDNLCEILEVDKDCPCRTSKTKNCPASHRTKLSPAFTDLRKAWSQDTESLNKVIRRLNKRGKGSSPDDALDALITGAKTQLRVKFFEILDSLGLRMGEHLPMILEPKDKRHYKAGAYHPFLIYLKD